MKRNRGFDEVMIVNPYEPGSNANQGARLMRFYAAPPGMGYYAEPPGEYGYYAESPDAYGYYAESPDAYGYYAEPEQYGEFAPGYGQAEPVGYIAENYPIGYYGDPYAMGAYGEPEPMGYYGYYGEPEPMGYYGEPEPMGYYGYYAEAPPMDGYYGYAPMGYYAEAPQMEGHYGYAPMGQYAKTPEYGQYAETYEMPGYSEYEPLAENYSEMGAYGEYGDGYGEDYSGYVRETEPRYNAGCPMPTNVHGFSEVDGIDGYVRPSTVNPTCGQFTPAPRPSSAMPESFKPLW